MTGYDRRGHLPVLRFDFDGSALAGFWFKAYAPSYEGAVAAILLDHAERTRASVPRWLLALRPVLLDLGDALTEWNLVRGGVPVPPSTAALLRLDRPMLVEMVRAWSAAPTAVLNATAPDQLRDQADDVDDDVDEDDLFELAIPQSVEPETTDPVPATA
ncbi:hypothetical protein [Actinokineospora sp. UTMC 2448]|uniref:hypothetical protein n=1 Tax=Actinokineospora sp. UTMC 2448 TaxID=2268449 RepID=UPI00216433D1|nr:hypothetical protein [Actinokineospora sp. UTMC 2448]UVS81849.1 hypothetical protein Actkin_05613 [Actinokineospora sp. UTMC 2448]